MVSWFKKAGSIVFQYLYSNDNFLANIGKLI